MADDSVPFRIDTRRRAGTNRKEVWRAKGKGFDTFVCELTPKLGGFSYSCHSGHEILYVKGWASTREKALAKVEKRFPRKWSCRRPVGVWERELTVQEREFRDLVKSIEQEL